MSSAAKLVPPTLPPEVLQFLTWLEKTEGRDKLYRLVAYASKFLVDSLRTYSAQPPVDVIARLERGASVVAMSRKLFRMFRSLESTAAQNTRIPQLPAALSVRRSTHPMHASACLLCSSQLSASCAGELCAD